jgi:hypothetical protein
MRYACLKRTPPKNPHACAKEGKRKTISPLLDKYSRMSMQLLEEDEGGRRDERRRRKKKKKKKKLALALIEVLLHITLLDFTYHSF